MGSGSKENCFFCWMIFNFQQHSSSEAARPASIFFLINPGSFVTPWRKPSLRPWGRATESQEVKGSLVFTWAQLLQLHKLRLCLIVSFCSFLHLHCFPSSFVRNLPRSSFQSCWIRVIVTCIIFWGDLVSAFAKKPKSQEAVEGSTVVFEAQTEKPDAKVKWQCDSKDVVAGGRYVISADGNKHSLSIRDVAREDANGYAVIAGGSKVKFELKVAPKPGGRPWCCSLTCAVKARRHGEIKGSSRWPHCCTATHHSTCTVAKN